MVGKCSHVAYHLYVVCVIDIANVEGNDYFGEELKRVEQVEYLDYEYIFEFLDRHEPVNAVGLPNVKGRLKSHLAFWTDKVTRSRFILPRSQRLFLIIAPLTFMLILFQKRYQNCYPCVE
jgi:hypothetical protein